MSAAETLLYSALAPLLPTFEEQFGLSKAQAGLLVAAAPMGMIFAALPIGLLGARVGVKRSSVSGLVMLAATSVSFGLVNSYGALLATLILQGAAGALCWSSGLAWLVEVGRRERRGELIGLISSAGAACAVLGPAVGGVAAVIGRAEAFAGVACCILLLAIAAARLPSASRGQQPRLKVIWEANSAAGVLRGQWLVLLPGLLLGTIGVLAPLSLDQLGWGPVGIAVTFLLAACAGVLARPVVGRWADRRGRLRALGLLLFASIPMSVVIPWVDNRWVLAACVICAVTGYGVLWGPAMAVLSDAYEDATIPQVLGFALMNVAAGLGIVIGSAAGGTVAQRAGDVTAYALAAGMSLATALALALALREQHSAELRARADARS
jgi:MFS family permease